jgi:hypothetical protein
MMRLKHILGPSIPKTEARVLRALRAPKFHLFVMTIGALTGLVNPTIGLAEAPIFIQIGFWIAASALFVPVYCAYEILGLRLMLRLGRQNVPELAVSVLSALTVAGTLMPLLPLFGVRLSIVEMVVGTLTSLIFLQIASYLFIRYVDVVLFPELYGAPTDQGLSLPPPGSNLFLQGTTLPLWKVEIIRADAQYTEVSTDTETQRVRTRFSNLIAELPTDLGFQIHRSIWISRELALQTRKEARKLYVTTPNGSLMPVARDREREFMNWLAVQGAPYAALVQQLKK